MSEYNSITQLIKFLFHQCKNILINQGIFYFINLIALQSIITLSIILFSEWINNNINIFVFSIPMLLLRISLFSLFLGIWIGYFKILFQYIDGKQFSLLKVINYFYLLPQILILRILSYLTILPLIIFIIYKFQFHYNLTNYGSDINAFLIDLSHQITTIYLDDISWQMISSYLGAIDIIILSIFLILPIWYSVRFWCAELLIIDKEMNIQQSLIMSYSLTTNFIQFIIIGFIILLVNLIFALLGYLFFTVGLTISYICLFLYYRYLQSTMVNQPLNK
tara:strand:- start:246 stop:1079 length:834 start_codon:yes stop_codon:yes gene_type:complete